MAAAARICPDIVAPGAPDARLHEPLIRLPRSLAAAVLPATGLEISGAGVTFPYPIYAKWADAYKKESGTELNYQSIGSGGGVKQIKAKTVAFEASDDPLLRAELEREALVQFPMVMAGIVPVVNVPGVTPGQLVLDGPTLAKSFSATSRLGMTPRSPSSIPVSSCHRNRSLSFTARTVQARLSTSPIIWTR